MASKDELYNILNRMKKDIWLLVKQYNIKDIEVEIDDGINISEKTIHRLESNAKKSTTADFCKAYNTDATSFTTNCSKIP